MFKVVQLSVAVLATFGAAEGLSLNGRNGQKYASVGRREAELNTTIAGPIEASEAEHAVAIPKSSLVGSKAKAESREPVYDTVMAGDVAVGTLDVPAHLPGAQEEAPLGMSTIVGAQDAPVGALELPDDLPGEGMFSAASFVEETFGEAGVSQRSSTNYDVKECPAGTGRPVNQPDAECRKPRGNVEGYTFIDENQDGLKVAGEVGVAGILITVSNRAATFRASVRTDATGHYQIKNLPPGTYYLTIDITSNPKGMTPVFDQVAVAVQPFTNLLQDFPFTGVIPPVVFNQASIESYIFIDANDNNAFDSADVAVAGVTVNLIDQIEEITVQTVISDERGLYSFSGISPGAYIVRLDLATISNELTAKRSEYTTELKAAQIFTSGLFALSPPAPSAGIGPCSIFLDQNRNGVVDRTERGVPKVIVKLMTSVTTTVDSTLTDNMGLFSFNGLVAGTYIVQIDLSTLPPNHTPVPADGRYVITLTQGQVDKNANFAIQTPAVGAVGQSLFYIDTNNNGQPDNNEPGMANAVVRLVGETGKAVATTTIGSDGKFRFDKIQIGNYTVEVDPRSVPSRYTLDDPKPPAVAIVEGKTTEGITIRAAEKLGQIKDGVAFVDGNRDGLLGANEAPVPDAKILLVFNGEVIQNTTTDAAGKYSFTNVPPGIHVIKVDKSSIPFGLSTILEQGEYQVNVQPSSTITGPSVNIPFQKNALSTISGDVLESGDIAMPNVRVAFMDSYGKVVTTTATDANGKFIVPNLIAGTYNIEVDESTIRNGLVPDNENTPKLTAAVAWNDGLDIEFRYKSAYAIIGPGIVFVDSNMSGDKSPEEITVSDVAIDLRDIQQNVISTIKTDVNGTYKFERVKPGTYEVHVLMNTVPETYAVVKRKYTVEVAAGDHYSGNGANFPLRDMNAPSSVASSVVSSVASTVVSSTEVASSTAVSTEVASSTAQTSTAIPLQTTNIGLARGTGSINGMIFQDMNNNGVPDAGDKSLAGIKINLMADGKVLTTQTSASNGRYAFNYLPTAVYTVQVDETTIPSGHKVGRSSATVSITNGQTYYGSDVYFGIAPSAETSAGVVGGLFAENNSPLSDVTVYLQNAAGNVEHTAKTGLNGVFFFPSVMKGTFTVVVDTATLPSGLELVYDMDGTLDNKSTITTSNNAVTVIFRYKQTGGNVVVGPSYVFDDNNRNMVQDANEKGIQNARVLLQDSNGVIVSSVMTDPAGMYKFDTALPGTYTLRVDETSVPRDTKLPKNDISVTIGSGPVPKINFPVFPSVNWS